jgi:hypothetical protein
VGKRVAEASLNDLRHFGNEVRVARQGKRISQKALGNSAGGYSISYVSKVEAGAILCSERFAQGCDVVFNTNGVFARLREKITERSDPSWFRPYLQLEGEARTILDYSMTLVMGLLQTEGYATAIYRAQNPLMTPEEIKKNVDSRLGRRKVLSRERPPLLWTVLHENCLSTKVGNDGVMADQLTHLLGEAQSPSINVQVLPGGVLPPAWASFTLLTFEDKSSMVYSETIMSGQMTDEMESVAAARDIYDRLRAEALPEAQSLALIGKYLEEYTR